MPEFVYFIRATREGFKTEATPEESAVMGEHFQYLKGLIADGTALLVGPCLDRSLGLVIFRAPDEAAARAIMLADPSIQHGVMHGECKPFRVSLLAQDWPGE